MLLLGTLPQITLPVRAGIISDYSIDGLDYWVCWSEDEWNVGMVYMTCEYCAESAEMLTTDGDHENAAYELIDFLFPYDCDHCKNCAGDYHCSNCGGCFESGEVEECPLCNTTMCLDCHEDDYFCDICGECRLKDDADGRTLSGHIVNNLPNLHAVCGDCLDDVQECVSCGNVLSIAGSYYPYDEEGVDWCKDCGLCGRCFENTGILEEYGHCVICSICGENASVCPECHLCEDCNYDVTHCVRCDTCFPEGVEMCLYGGDHCVDCCEKEYWLCEQCLGCTEALGLSFCEDCGLCEECCLSNSEEAECVHGFCVESADYYDHLCPSCGLCPMDMECEYCGMCEDCQEDYHCMHGICPEDEDEWEQHLCFECGDCFDEDELCELCHLCQSCQEHCEHGLCPEDPEYEDHFCDDCGECYEEFEFCEDCGLCLNCCEYNTLLMNCNHGLCVESDEFSEHYCFEDCQCLDECDHDAECKHLHTGAVWESNHASHWHVCEDCGVSVDSEAHVAGEPVIVEEPNHMTGKNGRARISCKICGQYMETVTIPCIEIPKNGAPYIISEPRDYAGKISDVTVNNILRYATYRVSAGGEDLKFQWYRRVNGVNPKKLEDRTGNEYFYNISGIEEIRGATTNRLTVLVYGESCYELYEYWCVVTNDYGSVTTRYAKQDAQHVFGNYCDNGDGTHSNCCFGDGCDAVKGEPATHRYDEWELKQAATDTQLGVREQTCQDCGRVHRYYIPMVEPGHEHSFTIRKRSPTKHWYQCVCGERINEQPHTLSEWETVKLPTVEADGRRERRCSGCGYVQTEAIQKLSHVHDFEKLKKNDPKKVIDQRFVLPNGYITEEAHVRYCARCTSTHAEPHRYGYWSLTRYPYTDSNGVRQQGVVSRFCQECGHSDSRYFDKGTWPVMTEIWNADSGTGTGGPATIFGTVAADPGDTVTVRAAPFEGYLLSDARQGWGAWSFSEVTSQEGTTIGGTWCAFKNSEVQNKKLNSDGSISFTMPDGPVGLMVFLAPCDHAGADTTEETIEPSCTGYGSIVERCLRCGGVVRETDYIEPIKHNWVFHSIDQDGDCDLREIDTYRCTRCGKFWDRPGDFVHEWVDVDEGVEATCFKAGREANQECKYCGEIRLGERIPAYGSHRFGSWTTVKEPTTRTKGQKTRTCTRCGFAESEFLDYTGPDFRIKPDKTRIHFDFTYGEQPEPQTVTFSSVGRDKVHSVTRADGIKYGTMTRQRLDGMTMTVEAVPWEMADVMIDDSEQLRVYAVDGVNLPEEDLVDIEVTANIRKTPEKYELTVEGGKAYYAQADKSTAKASQSVRGGEIMTLLPDNEDAFVRWEITEDASGYLRNRLDSYYWDCTFPDMLLVMPPNQATVRALSAQTPGVYAVTLDGRGGSVISPKVYTDSRGKIDYLPNARLSDHLFDGWYTQAEGGEEVKAGAKLTRDTTLYAHWREKTAGQYKISFDPNGGTVGTGSVLTVDGELSGMPTPTHPQLHFDGWYTAPAGGAFVGAWTKFTEDTVLYAHWDYGLEIAGVKVTDQNREDILRNGIFSFDGVGTLTVKGSYRTTKPANLIHNIGFKGLVINIAQDASLSSKKDFDPIHLEADTTITGQGTLSVTGGATGIYMNSKTGTLTLRNISVEAANQWGVAGPNGENSAKLVLDNAGIKAGCVTAAICDFGGGITMKDCAIVYPKDGRISDDGTDVVDADGSEAHTVIIEAAGPVAPPDDFRFDDVRDGSKFFFAPVYWAYGTSPQITNGVDAAHFGPDRGCTRGQVVTFLWRAAGCPAPTSTQTAFTDVKPGAFYEKAVAWAVENKITNGMSPTSFAPDATCTRGQIVTFLWRFRNTPEPGGAGNPFADVTDGAYYYKAVLWAVENAVTNGMSPTSFAPNSTCTRGQIVTFLYRAMQG